MSFLNRLICVMGLGSVGGWIAACLARLGYRRFALVDTDRVEAKNVAKSVYTLDDVGMKKIDALEAHLKAINPHVRCMKFDRFIQDLDHRMWEAIFECELVLEMADSRQGSETCVERLMGHYHQTGEAIPLVKMLCLDNIGAGVTMLWVPGSSQPCPCCLFRATPQINTSDEREHRPDPDYSSDHITGFSVRGVLPDLLFGLSLTTSLIHALLFEPTPDQSHSGRLLAAEPMLENGSNILLWSPFRDPYLEWQLPQHMGGCIVLRLADQLPCPHCGRYMPDAEDEEVLALE